MSEEVPRRIVGDHFFIHNCLGAFYKGILNWFGDQFYERFEYKVIGTYDKAVEFFNKKKQLGHEVNTNLLPSITLDPNYDFSQDERAGKFLWQSSRLAPGIGAKLFDYVDFKEQDVIVTPVFSRYQGTFEIIFWMSSVYELIDFRTMLLQYTGGFGRIINPAEFWSFIVLPDVIHNFTNEDSVPLDWGDSHETLLHIDSINQEKHTIPVLLTPHLKLDSFGDSSTKYSSDQIAEYKLSASFTYEINIPTYMVLINKVWPKLTFSFSMMSCHSSYGLQSPISIVRELNSVPKYHGIESYMRFWRIKKEVRLENDPIIYESDATIYPEAHHAIDYRPIQHGKLVYINFENKDCIGFKKYDILLIENYHVQFLPFIRSANVVICKNGQKESLLYCKAMAMKKPTIMNLSDENWDTLKDNTGSQITVDLFNKQIFLGELEIEEIQPDDPEYAHDVINKIKEDEPELMREILAKKPVPEVVASAYCGCGVCDGLPLLLKEEADGVGTEFAIKIEVRETNRVKVYVDEELQNQDIYGTGNGDYRIINNKVVFYNPPVEGSQIQMTSEGFMVQDYAIQAIYEFSESDVLSTDSIEIQLPFTCTLIQDVVLTSYCGLMICDRDYDLDLDSQIITVKLKAKEGEVIEIYKAEDLK